MAALDPEAVEAFVLVAEQRSFTKAADILGTTQAAVSLKIKRLEARLGHRLLDRTPRRCQLSRDGDRFLDAARELVHAHKHALGALESRPLRLTVGVTHHLVGPALPVVLRGIATNNPALTLDLRIGDTSGLLGLLDDGKVDAAILLQRAKDRRRGEPLYRESFIWAASEQFAGRKGEALPIALQAQPCHIREMTVKALSRTTLAWREAIVGGGAIAVGAAATAGLAIAAMGRTALPQGVVDVTRRFSLPPLGIKQVVLHANVRDPASRQILLAIGKSMQAVSTAAERRVR